MHVEATKLTVGWTTRILSLVAAIAVLGCFSAPTRDSAGGASHGNGKRTRRETGGKVDHSSQEAMRILSGVREKYKGLKSFRCRQISETHVQGVPGEAKAEIVVYFERPARLRVETEAPNGYADILVASTGGVWVRPAPRPWIHGNLSRKEDSLALALAGLQGASAGRVWIIPALLGLPGTLEQMPLHAENVRMTGEEVIDGRACYRIEGTRRDDKEVATVRYWIDKETQVVRRLESRSEFRDNGSLPEYLQAYEMSSEDGRRLAEKVRAVLRERKGAQVIEDDTFREIALDTSIPTTLFTAPR